MGLSGIRKGDLEFFLFFQFESTTNSITMSTLETTGCPRKISEANFSPRKENKKMCVVSETDAEKALDAITLKEMLRDQGSLLATMGPYVEELTEDKITEKDPRQLLKVLLMGGVHGRGRASRQQ